MSYNPSQCNWWEWQLCTVLSYTIWNQQAWNVGNLKPSIINNIHNFMYIIRQREMSKYNVMLIPQTGEEHGDNSCIYTNYNSKND